MKIQFIQDFIDLIRLHISKEAILECYKKFQEIESKRNNIETLVLGSSHGAYGFVAKNNEFNLCLPSQDLYYSWELYNKYAKLPNLKNIILFYSVFSSGFVMDKTSEKQRALSYEKIFKIPILNNSLYLKLLKLSFNHYFNKIKDLSQKNNNGNLEKYTFADVSILSAKKRAEQHYKHNQRAEKQTIWLEKLISSAKEKDQQVYIVLPPATKSYREVLPDKKELFKEIFEIKKTFNIEICDLYDSSIFFESDFGDWDHLNLKGAMKLTDFVRKKICDTTQHCKCTLSNNFDKLKKKIDKCEVVSFDIFDTLLLRPFIEPQDVFAYLEIFLNEPNFRKKRLRAEGKARKKFRLKEEIDIDNIYEMLPKKFLKYKEIEKKFEFQILTPNIEMLEIFNYAKSKGKRIIITSDMYLDRFFLEKLLIHNGFKGFERLFVSSEIGLRKSSSKLFDYIIQELNIAPNVIIHIGDCKQSDYLAPISKGLNAYCYISPTKSFFEKYNYYKTTYQNLKNPIASLVLGSYIIEWNNNAQKDSDWNRIGYLLAGILAYGYTKFIDNCCKKYKFSDVLFVARDGFVLKKIFDYLNTTTISHYVYAPRTITMFGLCKNLENKNYMEAFFNYYPEMQKLVKNKKLTQNEKLNIIKRNFDLIKEKTNNLVEEYKQYLSSLKLHGNNIGVVDLCSNSASAQKLLARFLGDKIKKGIYWALGKSNKISFEEFKKSKNNLKPDFLIEYLITSPELPILGLKDSKVIYHPKTPELEKNIIHYKNIWHGEIELAKNILKYTENFEIPISYDFVCDYYNNFINNMSKDEIRLFDDVYFQGDIEHNSSVPYSTLIVAAIEKYNKKNQGGVKNVLRKIFRLRKSK